MSVKATAIRVGASSSSNMFNDTKLEAMTKVISYALENSPEEDVVGDCVTALETEYGSGNVSDTTATPRYMWVWNDEIDDWERICISATTINVDDGEATDGRIVVSIKETV